MFVEKNLDVIKTVVRDGQRPDLALIAGPETVSRVRPQSLSSLIKDWISRCWHQKPDHRPSFTGTYDVN